ncbi:unnamed protein product [Rotaria sp. Silwood1]|nr:unnamed protein product [Rotaria sp. Silwood1]
MDPERKIPYPYQIVPYCIRFFGLSSNLLVNNEKHVIHGISITFETLRRENITSQQLYLLSASIDVVERYQAFLESSHSSLSTQVFNNCSKPWFGEYCQYSFNLTWSFDKIVRNYFSDIKLQAGNSFTAETCYTFIECNRGPSPSCLDWREICDGKIDCLNDGRDEIDCEKLDLNECEEDEFRCSNGFCIPKELFNDDPLTPDCIDRSDEKYDQKESSNFDHRLSKICKRGILIYVNNFTENYCLCPPAYFGYRCEYQNQRVSLVLQFRTVEWRTVFTFVIMLVDENTNIHSSEQYDYVSLRDCRKKFNFYLLYSTQPKYVNQTYYVRIDIYNKEKMEYYDTMFYPIRYSFLPVHRLALLVDVPIRDVATVSKKCLLKCLHGQCRYFSNFDKYFCQCLNGYSGMLCTIKNSCDCSPDSIYVGIVNNRSICICPLDKFGPRCYLKRTGCISNLCSNSSRCIANDETYSETEYYCLCSQGYMGSRCENPETKIEFLFAKTISIPQTMFIYFIYIPSISKSYSSPPADPPQIIMVSKLKFYESSSFVYFGGEFHIIFVKIHQHYYLALLRHNSTLGINISTTIIPEHRCLSIKDLFTDNIPILPRWHRAKHYHIPCQKHSNLVCFYDNDFFMCLCDIDRNANCFKFDYRPLYKCFGYNYCENDGQCHIDNSTCPTSSSCFCKECYYGSRCQFTTTGFGLSLDDILGYNIWPNIPFSRQPKVVKISTALTVVMFFIGIINGLLSMITFQTKRSLAIGSGLYLLASAITSFLTMTIFALKFLFLLLSQMSIITNYSFLLSNCICIDMFLKAFSTIGQWLNACVSVEQVFIVRFRTKFNKKDSVILEMEIFKKISFNVQQIKLICKSITDKIRKELGIMIRVTDNHPELLIESQ